MTECRIQAVNHTGGAGIDVQPQPEVGAAGFIGADPVTVVKGRVIRGRGRFAGGERVRQLDGMVAVLADAQHPEPGRAERCDDHRRKREHTRNSGVVFRHGFILDRLIPASNPGAAAGIGRGFLPRRVRHV